MKRGRDRRELNQLSTTVYRQQDHIRTCFVYGGGVMLGRRAGSGVGKYKDESPKQGSKRFNSQVRRNTLPTWVYYVAILRTHQIYPSKFDVNHPPYCTVCNIFSNEVKVTINVSYIFRLFLS